MDIAFIIDPLSSLNVRKDSSIAMMEAAQNRGHKISVIYPEDIIYECPRITAICRPISINIQQIRWYEEKNFEVRPLESFDVVLMRKDPPVDTEYIYLTFLLEIAEKNGAKIINKPSAVRNNNEKLAISEYPEFVAPTIVSKKIEKIKSFAKSHGTIVIKPLDGMGGSSVFKVSVGDPNTNVIIETLTKNGNRTVMAQMFLSDITLGDKRILLIDGIPQPFSLARVPQGDEIRGNIAAGGKGIAMALTRKEYEIATRIGPAAEKKGLFIVGLDIIGEYLTEINVTCPTCMREIATQNDCNIAKNVICNIERKWG